jgi:Tfp pilus assembly protein PilF
MEAYAELGWAYSEMGKPAEALEPYKAAINLAPDNSQLHSLLADVYDKMGDMESATVRRGIAERLERSGAATVPSAAPPSS